MTDNTAQLQEMIDKATGVVTFPVGDWWIDPRAVEIQGAGAGLLLRSGTDLIIPMGCNLRALASEKDWSRVLLAEGVEHVTVELSGAIIGEQQVHTGEVGTGHGMGVMFSNSVDCVLFGQGSITQCHGDAVYIIGVKTAIVQQVTCASNNRNGMSVVDVDGLTVRTAAFNFNRGLAPNAGIDLEPDFPTQGIRNVDIDYCQFVGNAGPGVQFGFAADTSRANFSQVHVGTHNQYKDNKPIGGVNTWYTDASYAALRWMPGYDWWFWPRSYSI